MKYAPGTYFFRDRDGRGFLYVLVKDGERAGETRSRKDAAAWVTANEVA